MGLLPFYRRERERQSSAHINDHAPRYSLLYIVREAWGCVHPSWFHESSRNALFTSFRARYAVYCFIKETSINSKNVVPVVRKTGIEPMGALLWHIPAQVI